MSPTVQNLLMSFGVGLIVLAVGSILVKGHRRTIATLALGVALVTFIVWPRTTLVEVPDVSNLSRDEAVQVLENAELAVEVVPLIASGTPAHHVVPNSQNPMTGTRVRPGTVVQIGVSTEASESAVVVPATTQSVTVFEPAGETGVTPVLGADGIYRIEIEGSLQGPLEDASLLLWIQPIEPPGDPPGWYLQRLPANGIQSISGNRWRGLGQIGNRQWPPSDGQRVAVAATLVSNTEAERLLGRSGPVTVIRLPGTVSNTVNVRLNMQ